MPPAAAQARSAARQPAGPSAQSSRGAARAAAPGAGTARTRRARQARSRRRARAVALDLRARVLDQLVVLHARTGRRSRRPCSRGSGRGAGRCVVEQLALLERLLHQHDAPARRVHLLAPEHVGRAGGQAEAAVHAVVDQLGLGRADVVERGGRCPIRSPPRSVRGCTRRPGRSAPSRGASALRPGRRPARPTGPAAPRTSSGASSTTHGAGASAARRRPVAATRSGAGRRAGAPRRARGRRADDAEAPTGALRRRARRTGAGATGHAHHRAARAPRAGRRAAPPTRPRRRSARPRAPPR